VLGGDLGHHISLASNREVGANLVHLTAAPIMTVGLCLTSLQAVLQVVGMECQGNEPTGTAKHGHMAPVGECG
jgi:hypothetical protein